MNRETFLDLIPAYALGALDADEREAFEAMLANDAEAQKLLAEYQGFTDLLVLTTPAQPAPAHLKDDLRKRLAAQRPTSAPVPEITALPKPPQPVIARRSNRTVAGLLALAAMLVVVFGAAWFLTRNQQKPSAQELYDSLASQPGAFSMTVVPDPSQQQITGDMVAGPDGKQAVIKVSNLPALSSDQTFQLWFIDDQSSVHASELFNGDNNEQATYIVLPLNAPIQDYQAVAVSIEPEGGSEQPTTTPIFAVPVTT